MTSFTTTNARPNRDLPPPPLLYLVERERQQQVDRRMTELERRVAHLERLNGCALGERWEGDDDRG